MLLIDFGQLSCDVCIEKDRNVFEDKEIAKFINDNFLLNSKKAEILYHEYEQYY